MKRAACLFAVVLPIVAATVAQADENARITRELHGTGLGTNTQVLDAVALKVEAANNHNNATLDESLAVLSLARAVETL